MKYTTRIVIPSLTIALIALVLGLQSFGQSKEQNTSTNKSVEEPAKRGGFEVKPEPQAPPADTDFSKLTWDLPPDAAQTKNPIAASAESIAKGKELYLTRKGNCIFCHGETGAGNEENLPKLRRQPADISDKTRMLTLPDGEIFWKITRGIPGIMPGREKQMTEEERWHVVNYVRTLAKEKPGN